MKTELNIEKMREQFEAWVEANLGLSIRRVPSGSYQSFGVYSAWEAWRASREALEHSQVSPKVQAMLKQFEADEAEEIRLADSFVRKTGRASISALQRNFKISYGNACRLMDKLVARGVVSSIDAEGRRTVLPEQAKP